MLLCILQTPFRCQHVPTLNLLYQHVINKASGEAMCLTASVECQLCAPLMSDLHANLVYRKGPYQPITAATIKTGGMSWPWNSEVKVKLLPRHCCFLLDTIWASNPRALQSICNPLGSQAYNAAWVPIIQASVEVKSLQFSTVLVAMEHKWNSGSHITSMASDSFVLHLEDCCLECYSYIDIVIDRSRPTRCVLCLFFSLLIC